MESLLAGAVASLISTIGAVYAARAARHSKPVANGFTKLVTESLARIESRLDDHLKDHA